MVKGMISGGYTILGIRVLVLGITFKENCADIRNSRVIDVVRVLESFGCTVDVYEELRNEYGLELIEYPSTGKYAGIFLAVGLFEFKDLEVRSLLSKNGFVYDVKSFLPKKVVDKRL